MLFSLIFTIITLLKFEIPMEINFIYYFDDISTLARIVHQFSRERLKKMGGLLGLERGNMKNV